MTSKNTAYSRMLREQKPQRGAAHVIMEDMADGLFRGPAKDSHDIDLVVVQAAAQRLTQSKLLEQLPDAAIPHLISRAGADDPATGILVFDGVLADALIEQQTLGRVSAASRVERAVTAIDAALSTAFATSIITKLASLCADNKMAKALQGYSCGRPQIDRAALSLLLPAKHYDVMCVDLDLGPGMKRGQAQLVVPAQVVADPSAVSKPRVNPEMVEAMQDATMRLRVQLPPIRLPLKTLISLQPDSMIELPPEALTQARVIDTKGGRLATAKLGPLKGNRAVRMQLEPGFAAPAPAPMPASLEATEQPKTDAIGPQDIGLASSPPEPQDLDTGDTRASDMLAS